MKHSLYFILLALSLGLLSCSNDYLKQPAEIWVKQNVLQLFQDGKIQGKITVGAITQSQADVLDSLKLSFKVRMANDSYNEDSISKQDIRKLIGLIDSERAARKRYSEKMGYEWELDYATVTYTYKLNGIEKKNTYDVYFDSNGNVINKPIRKEMNKELNQFFYYAN